MSKPILFMPNLLGCYVIDVRIYDKAKFSMTKFINYMTDIVCDEMYR